MFDSREHEARDVGSCANPPKIDPKIARLFSQEGVDLQSLPPRTELVVDTRNSQYRLTVLDESLNALVQGGRYFARQTVARVEGSTIGGSLLRIGWIGLGLCLEISVSGQRICTSRVRSIRIDNSPATVS
jgi:hypothetical protein